MALLSVNGKPALQVYDEVFAQTRDTSTEHAKVRRVLARMLFVRSGDSHTVRVARWRLQDGRVVNDDRVIEAKLSARESISPPTFASRVLPSGVAYVTMSGWSGSLSGRLQAAITAHGNSPALIIDLRDNPGGSADMVQKLLGRFVNKPTKLGTTTTRSGKPVSMFFGLLKLSEQEPLIRPTLPTYDKPTVVLVNESSASASELFSAAMQDLKRTVVMGERTCGCLTAFFGYQALPGGGSMAYSELAFKRGDGRVVEGNGVAPDKPVEVTREDIALGRDVVLEAAVIEALNLSSDPSKSTASKTKVATQN
jgi:carboxyl-terminal processing protease